MKVPFKIFSFCLLILSSFLPAESAPPQTPFHFTEAFKLAIKLRQEADDKLYDNMELLSSWMQDYKRQTGRFPEAGSDQYNAEQFFRRFLKANPYPSTLMQTKDAGSVCKVRFEYNSQINDQLIDQWRSKAPATWRALPGTIVITTNAENKVLIWGAGADQLPIIDNKTGKVRMVVCEAYYHPQSDAGVTEE